MKFTYARYYEDGSEWEKVYDTDKSFDRETIIKVIKAYEVKNTKLFECKCTTFSESGNVYFPTFRDIDSLKEIYEFDNPSIQVTAMYINTIDNSYKFSISMANNCRGMNYYYNKRHAKYVKERQNYDRMRKELNQNHGGKTDD